MQRGPKKKFDREEVLERAMEVFWEVGYEAAGLSKLLSAMGIGRQSMYDTFGDKRSLFLEALSHYVSTELAPIRSRLQADGSALDNIYAVMEMWRAMARHPEHRGCLVGNSFAEFGRSDPEVSQRLATYLQTMEDGFYEALERARIEGELAPNAPVRDLARMMVSTGHGLALLSKIRVDEDLIDGVLRSARSLLEMQRAAA